MTVPEASALLVLPHLRIQNANAVSSPLTWGFPAPSAFTGFAHALSRRMTGRYDLELEGVAVVCHRFEPQVSQPAGRRTYMFNLTRNPVDKEGRPAAIVEEGRIHLDATLVVGVRGPALYSGIDAQSIADNAWESASSMRIAGGSVLPPTHAMSRHRRPELVIWPDTLERRRQTTRQIARRLIPGFALVSREAKLKQRLEVLRKTNPNSTSVDALLDLSRLNFEPPIDDSPTKEWTLRPKNGWLVPIPVGYAAISRLFEPGAVSNVRDRTVPFRFVESVLSVGEWLSPHRVENICDLFWYHHADPESGLYRCSTPFYSTRIS
jgi:CRISPR-associated protein Csy2